MQGFLKTITAGLFLLLVGGCAADRDAVAQRTTARLDQFRELRTWLREDIGERNGLRVGQSSIGDFVRRDHDWVHRNRRDATFSETQVADALGLSVERIQRYLDTAQALDIRFAVQLPGDSGYASVSESSSGAWSGCSGFLHWGVEGKPDWIHVEDDWHLEWICEDQ